MRYEPYTYTGSRKPPTGKWQVIAAELSSGMAVDVANINEAKCLQRACKNRRLKASIHTSRNGMPRVIVW